jgi:hypothetical protein
MARYTNIKCGNCGHSFTGGYSPGNQSRLGVSKVKCAQCSSVNKTSAKPYSQFNSSDYLVFWIGRIIRILALGILYGGLLGFGLGSLSGSPSDSYILGGVFIGIIGNIIFNYFNIKHQIKEIEKEESDFETPEMAKERHMRVALNALSRVDNLTNKLVETFPTYDPSKSYDLWENEANYYELVKVKSEYVKDFEILTWPTTRMCTDESNKIFFEHIALYIKKADRNRFIEDKFNFNGPVYIQEDLSFDQNGKLLLWGYFEHSKTRVLLQQAKDHLSKGGKAQPDTPYFVINKAMSS